MSDLIDAVTRWQAQQQPYGLLWDYYRGRHQLRFASRDFAAKQAAKLLTDTVMSIRENLCPAAVSAFTDGISVAHWGAADTDDATQAAGLSRLESMVSRAAFAYGDAYAVVTDTDEGPQATFVRPESMVPTVDPIHPDRLERAARVWIDPTNHGRCNIWYTDRLERWRTVQPVRTSATDAATIPDVDDGWTGMDDEQGGEVVRHHHGVVPVCWWKRDPDDPWSHGSSILADVIPLQDAMNKALADLIVTSETYARPFYALLNHQGTGPTNPFAPQVKATPTRIDSNRQQIWTTDGPGPFLRFDPPDLTPLLRVQDAFAAKVARVVGAPSYYFSQTSGDVPSGESLRILSTRRTATIRAWQRDAEPVWRGLLELLGVEPGIRWDDPMPLDPVERVQVAQAKQAMGWPLVDIARELGEPDPEDLAARAAAAQEGQAAEMGRRLMRGDIGY